MPLTLQISMLAASTVNQHGGLVLPEYTKYVAELQRDEAFTMKQQRQWFEEQASAGRGTGFVPTGSSADGPHQRQDKESGGKGNRGRGRGRKGRAGAGGPAAPDQ